MKQPPSDLRPQRASSPQPRSPPVPITSPARLLGECTPEQPPRAAGTYPDSQVRQRILLMALQGNGPETISTPRLQHRHWDEAISPQFCDFPPPPRTIGDGGHDRLLGPLAGAAHRPHHVPAVAVGADDALPTLLPGQALKLLRGHTGRGSTHGMGPGEHTQGCSPTSPSTWFPRKRCWTTRVLCSQRTTSPRLYPMRS